MISALRLVIGNAMLHAVVNNMDEIDFNHFVVFRDTLNKRIQNHQIHRQLPDLCACDILEEAYKLTPFLRLGEPNPYQRFSVLHVNNDNEKRKEFIKILEIYYRNITPSWLRQEIDLMDTTVSS